jgi:hypothetical protein
MCPDAMKEEIDALIKQGMPVALMEASGQSYALVGGIEALVPPWDKRYYDILIAIPAADGAALDAFYLPLPYKFNDGTHPRAQGATITVKDRQWQLVSWHYPDGKPWKRGLDDLASHIAHCQGFFLHRGAVNAMQ